MRARFGWSGFGRFAAIAVATLFTAGTASAVQFVLPTADTRLHSISSGEPGAEWDTGGLGVNGELSYSSVTEILSFDAELNVLNYFDPNDGGCPTDVGSNCTHNYVTNLDLSVSASLESIDVTFLGGTFFELTVNFESTGGTDITLTDPTDSTVLLSASWQAGSFLGSPTTGLSATALYDTGSASVIGDLTLVGFAGAATGSYAQLLDSGGGSNLLVNIGEAFDFSPTLDALAATLVGTSTLASFTAEGEGQLFRVESGNFVPEPHAALLLGSILLAGAIARRRG